MAEITFESPSFSSILLDTVGALIVVLDAQSRIVLFNRACEQLTGFKFEEVRGKNVDQFLTYDEAPKVQDVIDRLLSGGAPNQFQNYWVTRSGERRWIEWSNSVVKDESGQPRFILATGIDATERTSKEKELRESEQRFSLLFRSSPAAISIHSNKDDSILDVNPIFEQWVGYSRDELIGQRLIELGIIDLNLSTVGLKDRARIVGKPAHGEAVLHARDGRTIFAAVSVVRVFLAGKDCLISSLQDITERKVFEKQILEMNEKLERRVQERTSELEQQIEQSLVLQDKLNQLLRASPVVILSIHPEPPFLITFVSENIETLFGYPVSHLVNGSGMWNELIHPDDRVRHQMIYRRLFEMNSSTTEVRFRKVDGQYCWIRLVLILVRNESGQPLEIHGSMQDITARLEYEKEIREREELYRSLAESARDFIFVIDKNDIVQYVNGYGAQTFGITPEDMIGKSRGLFFPTVHTNQMQTNLERVFAENQVFYYEEAIPFPKGDLWLGTRLVPIHDQQGQVSAVLGVSRDITERKGAENELQLALQKEKELNELRANFVSMMSHQVGTPLSTILSSAEMLEHYGEHWPRSRQQKHLERIIESTKRVDLMVRDILELGRVDASLIMGEESHANLVELCQNLVELFQTSDHEIHQISFLPPAYPVFCRIDEHLVQQALENLLSNALKYSPRGTQIVLKLSIEGQRLLIQIDDQGFGISDADLKRIGTPFYRGKNVSRIPGTGLGLTLVMRSIAALGGKMTINSRENAGTSVVLDLPYHPALLPPEPAGGQYE